MLMRIDSCDPCGNMLTIAEAKCGENQIEHEVAFRG